MSNHKILLSTFCLVLSLASVRTIQAQGNCGGTLSIGTTSLPDGTVGVSYLSGAITASGGGNNYTWKVLSGTLPPGLAFSQAGSGGCTGIGSAPAQPTNLTSSVTLPNNVALSWTQSISLGVDGNKVYRSLSSTGGFAVIFTSGTPITTYTDTTGAVGTTYYYAVTATCSTCSPNESVDSNIVQANVPPIAPPTNLHVQAVSLQIDSAWKSMLFSEKHSITFAWDCTPVSMIYRVLRSNRHKGPYKTAGETKECKFTDHDVKPNHTYYYVVVRMYKGQQVRSEEFPVTVPKKK